MKNQLKKSIKIIRDETGQALPIVLILMLIGALIIVPLLNLMNTGISVGQIYEDKARELYAADAGVEDALWQIKNDRMPIKFATYDEYDYGAAYTYPSPLDVNGLDVNVTIKNIWIPKDIAAPNSVEAEELATGRLVVTGNTVDASTSQTKISYDRETTDPALFVEKIGIWLPPGFTYVAESSNLEDDPMAPYYPSSVDIVTYGGNQAVVWNFVPAIVFTNLPGVNPADDPMKANIIWQFTAAQSGQVPDAIGWVITSGVADIPYSWDADTKVFRINSVADSTEVEAYTLKSELRQVAAAIAGDYFATGNSLMTNTHSDTYYIRDTWTNADHSSSAIVDSDATGVNGTPDDSDVKHAYLYWTSWFHEDEKTQLFYDNCSNFDPDPPNDTGWDRNDTGGSDTRIPTADGDVTGTWNTAPCWDDVDETTPNDADFMTGTTTAAGSAYKLFTFSPFAIPAGANITDLTIYVRARDISNDSNNIRARIKVDGNYYNAATSNNPDNSWSGNTFSYSFATNPDTGAAWTAEDLNGTGPDPLEQFGAYSTDLDSDIRVSMVYAQANWATSSRWSISFDQFRGQGAAAANTAQRTLTMSDGLDLTSYTSGSVVLSWEQDASATVDSSDHFYYALYNGAWSDDIEVFNGNDPDNAFTLVVPDDYLVSNFKIRFYFDFNATDEYVYVDEIKLTTMEGDTSVFFKIDGQQVYFDALGNPQSGLQEITADRVEVIPTVISGEPNGFAYACFKNVTDLVRAFTDKAPDPETNYPGHATYTVGGVDGTLGDDDHPADGYQLAHAGWSLITIYTGPETLGHQLYLYDRFTFADDDTDLDFDKGDNPGPGGAISGFIVPERVGTEENVSKITVFVGEGDAFIDGRSFGSPSDFIAFNAPEDYWDGTLDPEDIPDSYKLWDGIDEDDYPDVQASDATNKPWKPDNVWNGHSTTFSADGVDIDTFYVPWDSNNDGEVDEDDMLSPGDTSAHIDMYTYTDNWNLVYIILSFRSITTTGGTVTYLIKK
ncbi:MAG: hypothetical protein PHU08_01640 [Dehalococcoidales bacterium]|nr:hypothetical protein [Dehalococcoidales bacterium]